MALCIKSKKQSAISEECVLILHGIISKKGKNTENMKAETSFSVKKMRENAMFNWSNEHD